MPSIQQAPVTTRLPFNQLTLLLPLLGCLVHVQQRLLALRQ
jgi:hypothetical protein